jgi:hypothetical protein
MTTYLIFKLKEKKKKKKLTQTVLASYKCWVMDKLELAPLLGNIYKRDYHFAAIISMLKERKTTKTKQKSLHQKLPEYNTYASSVNHGEDYTLEKTKTK